MYAVFFVDALTKIIRINQYEKKIVKLHSYNINLVLMISLCI